MKLTRRGGRIGRNKSFSIVTAPPHVCSGDRAQSRQGRRELVFVVPQQFIPRMIELYQVGQGPFDRLLKFYDFHEINRAVAGAMRGDTIKPVLRIDESLGV